MGITAQGTQQSTYPRLFSSPNQPPSPKIYLNKGGRDKSHFPQLWVRSSSLLLAHSLHLRMQNGHLPLKGSGFCFVPSFSVSSWRRFSIFLFLLTMYSWREGTKFSLHLTMHRDGRADPKGNKLSGEKPQGR